MPQHGRSPWTDFDYLDAADQVAAGGGADEPVAVVGHSMGGKIAMVLALRHPERVERLCAVDIAPVAYDSAHAFDRYVEPCGPSTSTAAREGGSRPCADRGCARPGGARLPAAEPPPHRRRHGWYWQPNLEVIGERLGVITAGRARSCRASYDGPVLWVRGGSEHVGDEHAEAMAALSLRVRKVTVKGSGHWVTASSRGLTSGALGDEDPSCSSWTSLREHHGPLAPTQPVERAVVAPRSAGRAESEMGGGCGGRCRASSAGAGTWSCGSRSW